MPINVFDLVFNSDLLVNKSTLESFALEVGSPTDPISLYCLGRFLKRSNWEFESTYLTKESEERLRDYISTLMFQKSTTSKVNKLMVLEYGYIFDTLKGKVASFQTVPFGELHTNNTGYVASLKSRDFLYSFQELFEIPIGIYLLEKGRFFLIDGYNRYVAAEHYLKENIKHRQMYKVPVIVYADKAYYRGTGIKLF